MARKTNIPTDDQLDAQVNTSHADDDTPVDAKVGIVRALTNTIMASTIIQVGILALFLALATAIVQGNIASMFGITFKDTQPHQQERPARPVQPDTTPTQAKAHP